MASTFQNKFMVALGLFFYFLMNLYGFAQHFPMETRPSLDQSNNMRNYLMRVASEITHSSLAGINTLDDLLKVREQRHREFLEMMGLTDVPITGERPPLNKKITGTIFKDGFRIEKLYYESLPHLYVPANLYIPEGITDPVPAILFVCGHSQTQKFHYQPHVRKFAQLGFVCMVIETIQMGEVRGEHHGSYGGRRFHWYSRGYTPGGVELWNAIRGLDLLCQLPEVNADKLGVTGCSGGGAQSWFIGAADQRIKAVAPVCGTVTLEANIYQRTIDGHCDCMWPINTYLRDNHDIGALIAPRPLLIASADRDSHNPIESVRQVYNYLQNIYSLYGASDNLILVETPGRHAYHEISRTKIFSFFIKHLMGLNIPPSEVGDIDFLDIIYDKPPQEQLSEEELKVYVDRPPVDDRTTTIQDSFIALAEPPHITNKQELSAHRDTVVQFLREKTFRAFPKYPVPLDIRWLYRAQFTAPTPPDVWAKQFGGFPPPDRNVFSFVPEKDWRLKISVGWRHSSQEPHPIMLVLRSPNEERRSPYRFISALEKEWNIAYFDARGIGETGWNPNMQWHIRRASAWTGRTIASMRVYDTLRCLEALRTFEGVEPDRISIAATGEMCAIALYAALLDGNISTIILHDPPVSQNMPGNPDGHGEAIEMLSCLRITDLPQVVGLQFPAQIVITGTMPESYRWAQSLYRNLGGETSFMKVDSITEWMQMR